MDPVVKDVTMDWSGSKSKRAPLRESSQEEMTMIVTMDTLGDQEKVPVDLVLVVDVSGSMKEEEKLDTLKRALKGTLTGKWPDNKVEKPWVRDGDRLCIITFNNEPKIVFGLEKPNNQGYGLKTVLHKIHDAELQKVVGDLTAGGGTHMQKGLEEALKILKALPKDKDNHRPRGILLLSDGFENMGSKAAEVKVEGFHIDTIGFGNNHDQKLLERISRNSDGSGVYSNAFDHKKTFLQAISPSIGFLHQVVAKDLEVTLDLPRGMRVDTTVYRSTSKTEKIKGYVQQGATYRLFTSFYLAPGEEGDMEDVFTYQYKCSMCFVRGKESEQGPIQKMSILRTDAPAPRKRGLIGDDVVVTKGVRTEKTRLNHLEMIKKVRNLADADRFEDAKEMLAQGMDDMGILQGLPDHHISQQALTYMFFELEDILNAVDSREEYMTRGGRCYVATSIMAHEQQRYVARGDPGCRVRLFTTERTDVYLDYAIGFDNMAA